MFQKAMGSSHKARLISFWLTMNAIKWMNILPKTQCRPWSLLPHRESPRLQFLYQRDSPAFILSSAWRLYVILPAYRLPLGATLCPKILMKSKIMDQFLKISDADSRLCLHTTYSIIKDDGWCPMVAFLEYIYRVP